MRKKRQQTLYAIRYSNKWQVSFVVNLPLFLSSDYICISVCQPLSLVELVPSFFHFLTVLFYDFILLFFSPSLCLWFPHRHVENLIQWKGPNKSLQASKCLWKYFLNAHIITDYFIYCMWMDTRYSETIKCFLHCATYLKRNKQTEKNYF